MVIITFLMSNVAVEIAVLDEFLNFKKALHLTDDANGSPNHKKYSDVAV